MAAREVQKWKSNEWPTVSPAEREVFQRKIDALNERKSAERLASGIQMTEDDLYRTHELCQRLLARHSAERSQYAKSFQRRELMLAKLEYDLNQLESKLEPLEECSLCPPVFEVYDKGAWCLIFGPPPPSRRNPGC